LIPIIIIKGFPGFFGGRGGFGEEDSGIILKIIYRRLSFRRKRYQYF
jgi:hypothetical protein